MKTKTVHFSYGTCKDAALKIPAEACSIVQIVDLIRESFLEYMFNGRSLMSDEVLVSSIGRANFFAGALGGYETRLSPEDFKMVKSYADCDFSMAIAVARYREPGISTKEAFLIASKNTALSEFDRKALILMAEGV
jgi:hypothetical protein